MAQTITRKTKGVRRQGRRAGASGKPRGSMIDGLMRRIPLSDSQMQVALTSIILLCLLALAMIVAVYAGAVEAGRARLATIAADAGFEVRHVEVRGVERMNELRVYERVLGERDRAMPLVDLQALRTRLLELPYVKDARIIRQLPDGLIVDIVERVPHAVLRENGKLALIDIEGRRLESVTAGEADGMLIVSGEGVGEHMADLERLLDAAPGLREQVAAAEWVGRRRWDVTFVTGQNLALPQGEDRAAGALVSFARLDGANGLLGGRVAAFDMRNPDRIYLRVPGRAAEELARKEGS